MLETATTDSALREAYIQAHSSRAQAFRSAGLWIATSFTSILPVLKRKGASQSGQPLKCDCPA